MRELGFFVFFVCGLARADWRVTDIERQIRREILTIPAPFASEPCEKFLARKIFIVTEDFDGVAALLLPPQLENLNSRTLGFTDRVMAFRKARYHAIQSRRRPFGTRYWIRETREGAVPLLNDRRIQNEKLVFPLPDREAQFFFFGESLKTPALYAHARAFTSDPHFQRSRLRWQSEFMAFLHLMAGNHFRSIQLDRGGKFYVVQLDKNTDLQSDVLSELVLERSSWHLFEPGQQQFIPVKFFEF